MHVLQTTLVEWSLGGIVKCDECVGMILRLE